MIQVSPRNISLGEFLQLPETEPASEYINQQIFPKPMPQGEHSTIQGDLVTAINAVLKPTKIARAYPELRCTFGGISLIPDVSVFVWSRIPRKANGGVENIFSLAPDWTIEILSPEQRQARVTRNILSCLQQETQMGWLINPQDRSVFVYKPQQQVEVFDEPDQLLPVPSFAGGLQLTLGEVFGWLME